MKVDASVVVARRGGLSSAFDELNKFFTISGMPVASSQYWNGVHGREIGEAAEDSEGMQIMRTLAGNMAFFNEEYRPWKRTVRPAGKRGLCTNEFHSIAG